MVDIDKQNKEKNYFKNIIPILFIALIPFSWAAFVIGSVYRNATLVLFAIFVVLIRGNFNFSKSNTETLFFWAIYSFYSLISLLWSTDINNAITNCFGMVLMFIIALVFANKQQGGKADKLYDAAWIMVGLVCSLLFVFGSTAGVGNVGSRETLVILGTWTDPNEFAGALSVPIAISFYYVLQKSKLWVKILNVFAILVELYVILLSGSRGALLAALIALLITLFFSIKLTINCFLGFVVLIAISAPIVIYAILPNIPNDVMNRLSIEAIVSDGGTGRASIWQSGLSQYLKGDLATVLLGSGYGGVVANGMYGNTGTMHNQFIQILINYGLIGFILYLALLTRCFLVLVKKNRKYVGAFAGMMTLSMTLTLPPSYKPLWVLLLMAFVCDHSVCNGLRKEVKNEKAESGDKIKGDCTYG